MKLSLNGVRKARGDAKLGFVHPKYLYRGIALKTIKPGTKNNNKALYLAPQKTILPMKCVGRCGRGIRRSVSSDIRHSDDVQTTIQDSSQEASPPQPLGNRGVSQFPRENEVQRIE